MPKLHIDLETRSKIDLSKEGAWRYAEHESTEIVILSVSVDDGPVRTWDKTQPTETNDALEDYERAVAEGWTIYAHNIDFEFALLTHNKLQLPAPKVEQCRCTQSFCNIAAIPQSLKDSSAYLQLRSQKDKIGSRLIQIFSLPNKQGEFNDFTTEGLVTIAGARWTYLEAWFAFVEYCEQDVRAERDIERCLGALEPKGEELDLFHFTMRLNQRGIPIKP